MASPPAAAYPATPRRWSRPRYLRRQRNGVMQEADIYKVRRHHYLVAPISAELLKTLIVAAGATEDEEEDNEDLGAEDVGEPSLGQTDDDRESDGLGDDSWYGRGEAALGWANEGSQLSLGVPQADEAEPALGWANEGPQFRPATGYSGGETGESDGDYDAEDDDPGGDPLDLGEADYKPPAARRLSRLTAREPSIAS